MKEDMKSVIADTFSEMLEKEDIDKITVTRLIAQCHISRQTFYYHFKDIMDVLEWTFRRATQELVEQSLNAKDRLKALTAYITFVRLLRTWMAVDGIEKRIRMSSKYHNIFRLTIKNLLKIQLLTNLH